MADCAMADILSTIIRRAAFVFVVSRELFLLSFFFVFWRLLERIFHFSERERVKERRSNKETLKELTFSNPHNNIIIR